MAFAFCAGFAKGADRCGVCQRLLPDRYWTYNETECCSEACVDAIRPVCSQCKKAIYGDYMESDGKLYCSNTCFERKLPKCDICKAPILSGYSMTRRHYCDACMNKSTYCFSCGFPAAYPAKLADGRVTCSNCRRWAVDNLEEANAHYDRARRQLEAWTGLKIETLPTLEMVGRDRMEELTGTLRKSDSPLPVRGLYSRQTYLRKQGIFGEWKPNPKMDTETIYLIDHLHDEHFRIAAMHELMHDLIHEHFPRLENAPLWVHEGICQFAAAQYCLRRNYRDALEGIETCLDPDYGDGYRFIDRIAGFDGWHALRKWMESVDVESLPDAAPKK